MEFVPAGFVLPEPLRTPQFRLELLGPQHAASDFTAWTSSIDFIHGLPGWANSAWPSPMSFDANLGECEEHLRRSHAGLDFAYTALLPERTEVFGCVYFQPSRPNRAGIVHVRSWVTETHAELDKPLHDTVRYWLHEEWPWTEVHYARR